jgi:hypothetical protein
MADDNKRERMKGLIEDWRQRKSVHKSIYNPDVEDLAPVSSWPADLQEQYSGPDMPKVLCPGCGMPRRDGKHDGC